MSMQQVEATLSAWFAQWIIAPSSVREGIVTDFRKLCSVYRLDWQLEWALLAMDAATAHCVLRAA